MSRNRMITDRQLHMLRHALGLSQTGREYRNRYSPGPDAEADCAALESAGLMFSRELEWIPGRTYYVTDAGREVARGRNGG